MLRRKEKENRVRKIRSVRMGRPHREGDIQAKNHRKQGRKPCDYLGQGQSKEGEWYVQRPWGRNVPGAFKEQGGKNGWEKRSKREAKTWAFT